MEDKTLEPTQALDRFFAGVERRAFRMAQIATGNRDDALDIVQDAMLSLVQRYSRRKEDEWAPLFHRILQNGIKDWYRRNSTQSRWRLWLISSDDESHDPIQEQADIHAATPGDQLVLDRATDMVDKALKTLPPRQQQVFLLRTWEGLNVAETANAMRCSEGSVKSHYSRAVHTLRAKLGDHWE